MDTQKISDAAAKVKYWQDQLARFDNAVKGCPLRIEVAATDYADALEQCDRDMIQTLLRSRIEAKIKATETALKIIMQIEALNPPAA